MISKLKKLIKGEKQHFLKLCYQNNLTLNYQNNKNEFRILKSIFEDREYSDYFPFYKKATIIDIGAHFGYFSIFAKKNTDKNSSIIAIEPNKTNFVTLERNLKDCNITNIKCYDVGIGEKSGVAKLYQGGNTNHSIVQDYSLLKQNGSYKEVQIKTIEELVVENNLAQIDFLKMDCEGAEYLILKNTPTHIFDKIVTISMEFHDLKDNRFTGETIIKILVEKGFKIVKYKFDKTLMNLNYGKIIGTKIF